MSPAQKLLIGTWKSDKRRTLQTCHPYHCLRGAKKRKFGGIFGKLELRYTKTHVHHKLHDFEYRERYDVAAEDAESIVIRIHSEELKKRFALALAADLKDYFKPTLRHINFRRHRGRQYYWIGLGMYCEWFRKRD